MKAETDNIIYYSYGDLVMQIKCKRTNIGDKCYFLQSSGFIGLTPPGLTTEIRNAVSDGNIPKYGYHITCGNCPTKIHLRENGDSIDLD